MNPQMRGVRLPKVMKRFLYFGRCGRFGLDAKFGSTSNRDVGTTPRSYHNGSFYFLHFGYKLFSDMTMKAWWYHFTIHYLKSKINLFVISELYYNVVWREVFHLCGKLFDLEERFRKKINLCFEEAKKAIEIAKAKLVKEFALDRLEVL